MHAVTTEMKDNRRDLLPIDLLPFGFVIFFSLFFTVEVPHSDDWDLVPIIKQMKDGTLNWVTLDTPYCGHKMLVSWLFMGGEAILTHWNTYLFHLTILLFLFGAWMAIRPLAKERNALLQAAIFYWSWNQWVVWIWSSMLPYAMALFCVLWGLRLMKSTRYPSFFAALMLGMAGTFCYGAGISFWPAGLYLAIVVPRPVLQRILFVAVMLVGFYLFVQHPAVAPSAAATGMIRGTNILRMPFYFLDALSAPLAFAAMGLSMAVSIAGLLILAFNWRAFLKWPSIAAIIIAALTMVGILMVARGGGGALIGGMDSRYGGMEALFWVGLILLVDWRGSSRYLLASLVALCVIRSATRVPYLERVRRNDQIGIRALLHGSSEALVLKGAQTSPEEFARDVDLMRQWHYSLFGNPQGDLSK